MNDLQLAFLFPWITGILFFFVLWAAGIIGESDDMDDDDDQNGGEMMPLYAPARG